MQRQHEPSVVDEGKSSDFDVLIVGAGFGGMYALHHLRGLGFSVRVLEAGSGVGGTWFWNRYPGARCDVESMEYSYQFSEELQQEWEWTERYACQPEILRYANHVADRFDLRRDIQFNTRVKSAHFDDDTGRWSVETEEGSHLTAQFCVMATGNLSSTNVPKFKGIETFSGPWYHTGRWPAEGVDFTGKRVGIIGTGSSGVQSIPVIAKQAKHLFVFQRTANYSIPARHGPLDPHVQAAVKADYAGFRLRNNQMPGAFGSKIPWGSTKAVDSSPEEREAEYESRWERGGVGFLYGYTDHMIDPRANKFAADFARRKIREIVHDPAVADLLCPKQIIGCKRMCLDSGYYETYNRPNVTLIDVSTAPIEEITSHGLITGGKEFELDCLVFATGYDAVTGALTRIDIRGTGGRKLREKWTDGPRTYLGLGSAGFPNLFMITGPGSPGVLTALIPSIEHHVNWIGDCIVFMKQRGHTRIEPVVEAEDAWVAHVNEVARPTLWVTCNSWYIGANIPGKPRVFLPYLAGFPPYVRKCAEVAAAGYDGFALTPGDYDRGISSRQQIQV